jgi:hypothetical protein
MSQTPDPRERNTSRTDGGIPANKEVQQKTDPQITELKGLTDPAEPIEVKGTDNPFDDEISDKKEKED